MYSAEYRFKYTFLERCSKNIEYVLRLIEYS